MSEIEKYTVKKRKYLTFKLSDSARDFLYENPNLDAAMIARDALDEKIAKMRDGDLNE